jgi:hypothetical protein
LAPEEEIIFFGKAAAVRESSEDMVISYLIELHASGSLAAWSR